MDQPNDFEVQSPPTDGISSLSFSPQADFLAASSWDNQVRIWEVQPSGGTVPKASYWHEGAALCCQWSKDGMRLVSGGADKSARLFDVTTGQATQIAQHDGPVREVRWVDGASPIVATGSWDKTIKYWDLRAQTPVTAVTLSERVYSMDVVFPLLVVGTAERNILIYNLNNPTVPYKTLQSPLKWQTRVVSCFPNGTGFAIGSIEGRVGIQYVEEKDHTGNFSFKCHRDSQGNVFSVNDISFHPVHGTFSTAGSDGTFNFWDKDSKQRLKGFQNVGGPIPCSAFNRNGGIFAYAVSYDWSKGYQHAVPTNPNKIMLHATKDEDVKPRPAKKR